MNTKHNYTILSITLLCTLLGSNSIMHSAPWWPWSKTDKKKEAVKPDDVGVGLLDFVRGLEEATRRGLSVNYADRKLENATHVIRSMEANLSKKYTNEGSLEHFNTTKEQVETVVAEVSTKLFGQLDNSVQWDKSECRAAEAKLEAEICYRLKQHAGEQNVVECGNSPYKAMAVAGAAAMIIAAITKK